MITIEQLLDEAAASYVLFEKQRDRERMDKVTLFAKKLLRKQYTIGFAGHFSAGKSSMINALTEEELLPTSPIPTSANIVNVQKSDADYVMLYNMDGSALKYNGHDFKEAIKAFSKNGEDVARIDIGHATSTLPEGITVMDTPGVDSTDEAHALSTESSLHLSDVIFYTMDYNHVQSELNFTFTKQLMAYNPNVYLIVNQIDKHREEELSFEAFQQTVVESFATWGVHPKGIFYTSLRELDLPYNDFDKVKSLVDELMSDWEPHFIENGVATLRKLHDEHEAYVAKEVEEAKQSVDLTDEAYAQLATYEERLAEAKHERALLSSDAFQRSFEAERADLVEGATITPHDTRELLKAYVESKSPKFKVGFLFSGKKTEEERARRKRAFSDNLNGLLETQVERHLRILMKQTLRDANLMEDTYMQEIDALDLTIPFDEIDDVLAATEVVTGETVLNYTKLMRTRIEAVLRRLTDGWKEKMARLAEETGSDKTLALDRQIERLTEEVRVIRFVSGAEEHLETFARELEKDDLAMQNAKKRRMNEWECPLDYEEVDSYEEAVIEEALEQKEDDVLETDEEEIDADRVVDYAEHVARTIASIEQMDEWSTYLQTKARRLDEQQFTVALFGAFSAGKSSFSNALIGNKALPVSPNPTTAAINRIRPVNEEKAHEHADVHLKTEAIMLEDVARSYEALGMHVNSLEEALEEADRAIAKPLEDERLHLHKSFIRAYQKGYEAYRSSLGETLYVDKDEFSKFVAEEHRSCFVESIDFYFDSPLTRHGITLVDTPGADSINARHTDVAFEYIRNADAILFVTYYNHAFARADREFLIQLGRVKDAFEMDKMFFIVNAIDLAADEEEEEAVKAFVARELATFGIRHPRIFGVSSLEALQAKEQSTRYEPMASFEQSFYAFLENDLKGMAARALRDESREAVAHVADQIERAEQNQLRKEERTEELHTLRETIDARWTESFAPVLEPSLREETKELTYYVTQRVFLRFNDFLKEAYNPSTFAKYGKAEAMSRGMKQLLEMVAFDFTQELKVTNFRIGQFIERLIAERERKESEELLELDEALVVPPFERSEYELLTFEESFQDDARYTSTHRYIKSDKDFFQEGGRAAFIEALRPLVEEDAAAYMERETERLLQWGRQLLTDEADALLEHLRQEALRQVKAEFHLLEDAGQIEEWKAVYEQLAGDA